MSGEIPKPIAIRKSITNPETGGTLTVIQKQDKVAESIGHLLAVPSHILLGKPFDIGKNPSPELVDQLLERWKDVPWKGEEVVVRIGHTDFKEDWERTRKRLQNEGKLTPLAEVIGKTNTRIHSAHTSLTRGDSFSTFTRTVHLMSSDLAVGMHELGHAEDRLSGEKRSNRLVAEFRASQNAMKHMKTDEERKHAMKVLEPAVGSYIGGALQIIGSLVGLPVWSKALVSKEIIKTSKGTLMFRPKVPWAYVGTVALAHLYARIPWRKSTFGYVFEGKKPEDSLQPHQVYTATAKAK